MTVPSHAQTTSYLRLRNFPQILLPGGPKNTIRRELLQDLLVLFLQVKLDWLAKRPRIPVRVICWWMTHPHSASTSPFLFTRIRSTRNLPHHRHNHPTNHIITLTNNKSPVRRTKKARLQIVIPSLSLTISSRMRISSTQGRVEMMWTHPTPRGPFPENPPLTEVRDFLYWWTIYRLCSRSIYCNCLKWRIYSRKSKGIHVHFLFKSINKFTSITLRP